MSIHKRRLCASNILFNIILVFTPRSTGIRCQDLPTRSESLYRLSYPCPLLMNHIHKQVERKTAHKVGGFYIVYTGNVAKACSTHFGANYTLTPSFCKMVSNKIILLLDLPKSLNFPVCRLNIVYACALRACGTLVISHTTKFH